MATRGNACAGALAAALAAIEIQKLLDGDLANVAAGHEVLLDARRHSIFRSRLPRNPACRSSHERLSPSPTRDLPLREAFALAGSADGNTRLRVPDDAFVSRLSCDACGREEALWRMRGSLDRRTRHCRACSAERRLRGFDLVEELAQDALPNRILARPLSARGLRPGEVFALERPHEPTRHCVLDPTGDPPIAGAAVIVAGCGNIGSFLASLLPRLRGPSRVVLCDPDVYEAHQLTGQEIRPVHVGRNKARVQAARMRAVRRDLRVDAVAAPVEALPLGALRGAIVVSCLDSRATRRRLASRAWRMGCPFVDTAVGGGESLLVRTDVYLPADDAVCFECAWNSDDYASLEQTFPCDSQPDSPPTRKDDPAWTTRS